MPGAAKEFRQAHATVDSKLAVTAVLLDESRRRIEAEGRSPRHGKCAVEVDADINDFVVVVEPVGRLQIDVLLPIPGMHAQAALELPLPGSAVAPNRHIVGWLLGELGLVVSDGQIER